MSLFFLSRLSDFDTFDSFDLNIRFSRYKVFRTSFSPSGDGEIRTLDPLLARQVLSQLSYAPI